MSNKEWLAGLKVGDEVLIMYDYRQPGRIAKLNRETKLYWIVGDIKFRKDNGREPGDCWRRKFFEEPTEQAAMEIMRQKMLHSLNKARWDLLATSEIEAIYKILNAAQKRIEESSKVA